MKKAIKKVLVSALAVLLVIGFTAPAAEPVAAASNKVTVKTSTSKKVKTKIYKLKKIVKRKKVTTKKAKKKTVKTTNFAQAGNANISQLKGIVDDKVISEFNRVGMTIQTNPNSSLLKGADGRKEQFCRRQPCICSIKQQRVFCRGI